MKKDPKSDGAEEMWDDGVSYWTYCPKCNTRVVREELIEKGCYICGWKPDPDQLMAPESEEEAEEEIPMGYGRLYKDRKYVLGGVRSQKIKLLKNPDVGFGLIDLLLPLVMIPLKTPIWVGKKLRETAEKGMTDESTVHEDLLELQMRYELGEITDEEYEEGEDMLMARLEEIRRYKEEQGIVSEELEERGITGERR